MLLRLSIGSIPRIALNTPITVPSTMVLMKLTPTVQSARFWHIGFYTIVHQIGYSIAVPLIEPMQDILPVGSFITDPNMGYGTVCKIGDYWFYFGGITAEEMEPDEYVKVADLSGLTCMN